MLIYIKVNNLNQNICEKKEDTADGLVRIDSELIKRKFPDKFTLWKYLSQEKKLYLPDWTKRAQIVSSPCHLPKRRPRNIGYGACTLSSSI